VEHSREQIALAASNDGAEDGARQGEDKAVQESGGEAHEEGIARRCGKGTDYGPDEV
jgi:hypothetical protein